MTSSDVTEIYTLYKQQLNYVLVMSMICANGDCFCFIDCSVAITVAFAKNQ